MNMPETYFTQYIRPELLALVPVLYVIGTWLKKSTLRDENIPLCLGIIGVSLASLYVLAVFSLTGLRAWLIANITAITQGVLCAGAAVFANQLFKQGSKLKDCMCTQTAASAKKTKGENANTTLDDR